MSTTPGRSRPLLEFYEHLGISDHVFTPSFHTYTKPDPKVPFGGMTLSVKTCEVIGCTQGILNCYQFLLFRL